GRDAAPRPISAAGRRDRHSRSRDRRRSGRAGRRREAVEARRQGDGARGRRRLRRILSRARKSRAAGAAGPHARRGRRDPRDLLYRLHNAFERGRLKAGETLLVHGGSSGIGTAAIQLAKAFGARVIATAGSAEKCDACRRLGADVAINYKAQDFVAAAKAATEGKGADVILDMVGGDYIERNYEAAAVEGRVVQIALQAGPKATVNFHR